MSYRVYGQKGKIMLGQFIDKWYVTAVETTDNGYTREVTHSYKTEKGARKKFESIPSNCNPRLYRETTFVGQDILIASK